MSKETKSYPDNRRLLEYMEMRFSTVDNTLEKMEKHLEKLNGQVDSNSTFKNKAIGAIIVMNVLLAPMFIGWVINQFI